VGAGRGQIRFGFSSPTKDLGVPRDRDGEANQDRELLQGTVQEDLDTTTIQYNTILFLGTPYKR